MMLHVKKGLARLGRDFDRDLHIDTFPVKVHSSSGDARNVHQIINQSHHMLKLAFDHLFRPANIRIGVGTPGDDSHGVANGRQRISQLMR